MNAPRRALRGEHGQALTEFLVAAGTLVAFFIGTLLLGRYHDLQAATIQASRYAAFQRTVQPHTLGDALLAAETRIRFFAPAPAPLRSADAQESGPRWPREAALWLDPSGQRRLVATPEDVSVTTGDRRPPGVAGETVVRALGALRAASASPHRRLDLTERGFMTGEVAVRVADLTASDPDVTDTLLLRERTVVLADGWHAAGPAHTAERVASLTAGAWLQELGLVLRPVRWAAALIEPRFRQLCLGRIDPEVVPADRLVPDAAAGRGTWRAPC